MQDVREVLRRAQDGQSTRRIAKETGLDRKTVRRYLAEAKRQAVLDAPAVDEDAARSVGLRVQERPAVEPSQQWASLSAQRGRVEEWLSGEKPLRLVRVHELLARDGVQVWVHYATAAFERYIALAAQGAPVHEWPPP
jgi:transposase